MRLNELKVLSPEEILKVHEASLKILEETGLIIESQKVLKLLEESGCPVDYQSQTAKFPRKVVEKALLACPERFPLLNRDGTEAFVLGSGKCVCGSGHNAVFVMTEEGGERREATLNDVRNFAVLSDSLSEVDFIGVPWSPQDVNPHTALLYAVKQILDVSKKPIFFSCESDIINKAVVEMCKAVLGVSNINGRSNMISQLSTTSPLYWERGAAEALYLISKEGMPVAFLPQPIAGVTAPYTVAGLLTIHNTEVLSGIVITQLINPGLPVLYACAWTTYNMQQTNVLLGRPETHLLRIAGAQMSHFYKIPCHTTSPDTDSNLHDEQMGWEKMASAICAMAGGNDMLMNMGMFGTGMTITCEQLVMDNEMYRIARRMLQGIEVSDETIAANIIGSVGPRNVFLMEDHTMMYLRSAEHERMDVSNSLNYAAWNDAGKPTPVDNSKKTIEKILTAGIKNPLDAEKSKVLAAIIEKYEKEQSGGKN